MTPFRPQQFFLSLFFLAALALSAPAFAVTTGITTLPISLQGNYTVSSVSAKLNGSNLGFPLPNTSKTYSLVLGSKGLTAVTGSNISTLTKALGLGSTIKATVTSSSATTLAGTLSGSASYGGFAGVTIGSGSNFSAKVANPGVLTVTANINATVKVSIIPIPLNLGLTITLKKPAATTAKP
jgi:hypothetical protein